MRGYYNDPKATARTFDAQGRFLTGDKGYRDESGWFYFVDRKSNMIKRAGENISASEVEDVLLDHPDVAEAAVIGVDDPVRDQAVKAFVVLEEGARKDEEGRAFVLRRPSSRFQGSDVVRVSCGASSYECGKDREKATELTKLQCRRADARPIRMLVPARRRKSWQFQPKS